MVSRFVSNFTLGIGPSNPNGHPPPHVTPMPLGVAMAATAAAAAAAASVPPPPPSQQQGSSGQQQHQATTTTITIKGPPNSTEYHVQQCLIQGPSGPPQGPQHQHYRILHPRTDGYVAPASAGFSTPPSGPPHQGPAVLRGMQSTAPPTPPQQQDLNKMPQPAQQMFVPTAGSNASGNVRPNQQASLFRGGSNNTAPRGPRHNIAMAAPPMFSPQMQSVVLPSFSSYPTRQPTSQIYQPTTHFQFPQTQIANFPPYQYYFHVPPHRGNTVPSGIVQTPSGPTLGPGATQTQITMPSGALTSAGQTGTQPGTSNVVRPKRRPNAIAIINPQTNKNVLEEYELSKGQSTSNSESDYQEQLCLTGSEVLTSSTPQPQDQLGINADLNCSSKPIQGMAYVDIMQQHKISAMAPCSTQVINQVNEMIGPTTPIVSAMSDAPSVEIHPKQQTKNKKSKAIEITPPPPSSTEKSNEHKNQLIGHPEVGVTDTSESIGNSTDSNLSCSSVVKISEDNSISENKAIQSRNDVENIIQAAEVNTVDITSQEQSANNSLTTSPVPLQKIQFQLPLDQQQQQQNQQQHIKQFQTQSSSNTKRDTKLSSSASLPLSSSSPVPSSHSLPPLPPNSNNINPTSNILSNNNNPNSNITSKTTSTPSIQASNLSSVSTINLSSGQKQNISTINTGSNVISTNTAKSSKSKDKNQQQSSSAGSTNNSNNNSSGSSSNTNNQSTNISPSNQRDVNKDIRNQNNINNNNQSQSLQQHHKQTEKMRITEKDDKNKMDNSANDTSSRSNLEKGSSSLNLNNTTDNKVSDRNENIISCKVDPVIGDNSSTCSISTSSSDNGNTSNSNNINTHLDVSNNISADSKIINSQSSHDETDRIERTTDTTDENINYYNNKNNNNNNNDSITSSNSNKRSNSPIKSKMSAPTSASTTSTSTSPITKQTLTPTITTPATGAVSATNVNITSRNTNNEGETNIENTLSNKINEENDESKLSDKISNADNNTTKITNGYMNLSSTTAATTTPATISSVPTTVTPLSAKAKSEKLETPQQIKGQRPSSTTKSNGNRTYSREQLIKLRDAVLSRTKPNVVNQSSSYLFETRSPQSSLLPLFALNTNKRGQSMGARTLLPGNLSGSSNANSFLKQSSMSSVNAKNSSKGSKSDMIYVSLSLRENVKLNETENAWRPTHLKHDDTKPPEELEKDELIRKVRGILNKLTPEKFDTLVEQILKLQIDTPEKVNGVMELVFEKAVDEPNFSVSYARLCQNLGDIKVTSIDSKDQKPIFKSALIDKTEHEFHHNVIDSQTKENKLQPIIDKIKECNDTEKKLELQATLEEEERKIRRRSGGTVRFIGELFKISMLTGRIIHSCIENLLDQESEDKLECLCKLLTTVGKKFESTPINQKDPKGRKYNLDNVIKKMQSIADRKVETKISSRVRFMLQDVIDLRKNQWTSTKTDLNPKTMEQIQKEAKTEQMSNQFMNFGMISNKKDDRRYGSGGGSGAGNISFNSGSGNNSGGAGNAIHRNRQQQTSDDGNGWHTQTSKGNRAVDTSKLGQMFNQEIDKGTKLGGSQQFIWARPTTTTSNSFAPLSSLDSNKGSNSGPRNKGSYNKGSVERDRYDGASGRTGSTHGSRENSSSRNNSSRSSGTNAQKSSNYQNYNSNSALTSRSSSKTGGMAVSSPNAMMQKSSAPPPTPPIPQSISTYDDEEKAFKDISIAIHEMVEAGSEKYFEECVQIIEKFPEDMRWNIFYNIFYDYLHLAKTKQMHRKCLAEVILYLLNNKCLTIEQLKRGYQKFCKMADDIIIDVPSAWQYIFEFVGLLICKKIISVRDLWNDTLKNCGENFLKNLLTYYTREVGPDFTRNMWKNCNFKWTDFMDKDKVDRFITNNNFQYVESKDNDPVISGTADINKLMERIKELLSEHVTTDAIIDYISGNVVNIDKIFIRGLTTALCSFAIQYTNNNYKLDQNIFQKVCIPLFQRYIDSTENWELECLYAIQILINNLEHPPGLLSDLCGVLYDFDVIPPETFKKWRDSKDEPAGKGVAVKGLNQFFNNISSNDENSDENN